MRSAIASFAEARGCHVEEFLEHDLQPSAGCIRPSAIGSPEEFERRLPRIPAVEWSTDEH